MSSGTYDLFSKLVKLVLPALGAFYAAIASIWGLPYAVEIVGTLAALAVLGGVILQVSNKSYNADTARFDGALVVDTSNPLKDVYSLNVETPLQELRHKNEITLKIEPAA